MKALILLGCPETPSQTPMSIYASYKLSEKDELYEHRPI